MIPSHTLFVDGVTNVTADELNTFIQTALNLDDARGFIGAQNMCLYLQGYISPSDGGQGVFVWSETSSAPDDGGLTAIAPFGAPAVGRWLRILTVLSVPHQMLTFGNAGSSTFTVPQGVYQVKERMWGGGGGGGGCNATTTGGAGAGGGYSEGWQSVAPGQVVTVIVGVGGTGGAVGAAGGNGGTSSCLGMSATGGTGGGFGSGAGTNGAPGVPGMGSGGQLNLPGAAGQSNDLSNQSGVLTSFPGGGAFQAPGGISGQPTGGYGVWPGAGGAAGAGTGTIGAGGGTGATGAVIVEW